MVANSRVNPNFPIPGIDQSSRGFRDNFSAIKTEIEALQGKLIVMAGDVTATPVMIDSGDGDIVIDCVVAVTNAAAGGENYSVQFNRMGIVSGGGNLYWDYNNEVLTIGGHNTDSNFWLDSGNSRFFDQVLIDGSDQNLGNVIINPDSITINGNGSTKAIMSIGTDNFPSGDVTYINVSNLDNFTTHPLLIQFNGLTHTSIDTDGITVNNLGINNGHQLEVYSSDQDVATFTSLSGTSDNGVRFETSGIDSTMGLVLQNTYANWVGGIRIDDGGNVTLHTGENNFAALSTTSARLLINNVGQVGIGTTQPLNQLDINGGIRTTEYSESDPDNLVVATAGVNTVIDSMPMSRYRSARYTVQVTNPATGHIDVSCVIIMHANGLGYHDIYANTNSAGSLGTISSNVNGSNLELIYNATASNLRVKLEIHYITI